MQPYHDIAALAEAQVLCFLVSNAYYPRAEIYSESKPLPIAKTATGLTRIP